MSTAWFRFYEELNDFLPVASRRSVFPYEFQGNPSVKDAIESLGIPHPEAGVIMGNGSPVDFSFRLHDGDNINVYPASDNPGITGQPEGETMLVEVKFILDVHLGKLAKYLRLCGFDTYYRKDLTDNEIISLAISGNRIILTRDKGLLKNRIVTQGYWIRSQKPEIQVGEVLTRYDLRTRLAPFTRCLECNSPLVIVEKSEITLQIPERTRMFYDDFRKCTSCGRIFWKGSHYDRMKEYIEALAL